MYLYLIGPEVIGYIALTSVTSEAVGVNFKALKLIEGSIFQWSNSNAKLIIELFECTEAN